MGEIIEGKFGTKPKDEQKQSEQPARKKVIPTIDSAESLRAALIKQHEWHAANFYGLEKSRVSLIRSFKPHISTAQVEKTLKDYIKTYGVEDAVSVIKNSDEGVIRSKPAFFLAMLMKLDLYD